MHIQLRPTEIKLAWYVVCVLTCSLVSMTLTCEVGLNALLWHTEH